MNIELTINGINYQMDVPPELRLLDFLRDELGLKGTKKGCDQGECGACSVIINGKIVNSCLILIAQIPKKSEIITIETTDHIITQLQDSFIEHGATQCGACTPGMIMAAAAILKKNPHPNDREIRQGLSGVICRCTGYMKIFDAIKIVAEGLE